MKAERLVRKKSFKKARIQFEQPETDSDSNDRFCFTLCDSLKG